MATYNDDLLDAMLRHQIGVLQFSGSVRNQLWRLLDATEADLKRIIRDRVARTGLDTPGRINRLESMLGALREARIKGWDEVNKTWLDEMRSFALAEPAFFDGVIASAVPVELGSILPEPSRLRAIVQSRPYEGMTLPERIRDLKRADLARIEQEIKVGLIQGEGPVQISRRIVGQASLGGRGGVTQATRTHIATWVRTINNGIGSDVREEYLQANKDLAPQKVFVATLDSRTTPICRRFDGQVWRVDDPAAPVLPLHLGERSLWSPAVDGKVIGERPRRAFTQQQLVREYAKQNGLKIPKPKGQTAAAARKVIPRGHKAAFDKWSRGRMRELTGTVPAKTTYNQFLKRQSAAQQNDILGPTRGALFRRGGLDVDKFVEFDGTELTLSQLASRHADAFRRAGLDPTEFL